MMDIDSVMGLAPVIPVLMVDDIAHARPLAEALVAGGLPVLEVTLRTPQALACIEAIAKAIPEAVVGAGTLRSKADAQAAANAGARFADVDAIYRKALAEERQQVQPTWWRRLWNCGLKTATRAPRNSNRLF